MAILKLPIRSFLFPTNLELAWSWRIMGTMSYSKGLVIRVLNQHNVFSHGAPEQRHALAVSRKRKILNNF